MVVCIVAPKHFSLSFLKIFNSNFDKFLTIKMEAYTAREETIKSTILDRSKLKAFADDNMNVIKKLFFNTY